MRPENADYPVLAFGCTFGSFLHQILLLPQDGLHLATAGNQIGVRGTSQVLGSVVSESVFAPAGGKPLPTVDALKFPGHPSGTARVTISRWNEAVHVAVPAHAISYLKALNS
jgi:hypothetical protein